MVTEIFKWSPVISHRTLVPAVSSALTSTHETLHHIPYREKEGDKEAFAIALLGVGLFCQN